VKKILLHADLNLLRVLHLLLAEGSVTRAAKQLAVTPSALSKSLYRLRELFDDPLLVRSAGGLVPTPRAAELEPLLKQIFSQMEICFAAPLFDPASIQGRIRIAAPELLSFAFVPELVLRLGDKAPNLVVESHHLMDDYLGKLAVGSIDFVVNVEQPYPNDFSAQHIHTAMPVYWSRKKHPLTEKRNIDLPDILAYPLIAFHTQNISQADIRILQRKVAASGLAINIMFDTTNLLIAIDVMMKTDGLMLAPDYISRPPVFQDAIHAHSVSHIPAFDRFRINLSLVQHKRAFNSPLHRWIADEVVNIFSAETNAKSLRNNSPT